MPELGKETVALLEYLLPGFLAAWIFRGLTPGPRLSEFERVVQALIFTFIVQSLLFLEQAEFVVQWQLIAPGTWDSAAKAAAPALTALIVGLTFAAAANSDLFHMAARWLMITKETSFPSQWFSAFTKNVTYVVLQLNDERRLYGWPMEWPSDPHEGQFVLQQASWLSGEQEEPMTGVASIVIDVRDVKWVEFMERTWDNNS